MFFNECWHSRHCNLHVLYYKKDQKGKREARSMCLVWVKWGSNCSVCIPWLEPSERSRRKRRRRKKSRVKREEKSERELEASGAARIGPLLDRPAPYYIFHPARTHMKVVENIRKISEYFSAILFLTIIVAKLPLITRYTKKNKQINCERKNK